MLPGKKIQSLVLSAATAGLMSVGMGAHAAKAYPSQADTIVVPVGAGGSADVYARQLAEK